MLKTVKVLRPIVLSLQEEDLRVHSCVVLTVTQVQCSVATATMIRVIPLLLGQTECHPVYSPQQQLPQVVGTLVASQVPRPQPLKSKDVVMQ